MRRGIWCLGGDPHYSEMYLEPCRASAMEHFCENNYRVLPFLVDLVTFTEEIFNKKLHFLCSAIFSLCD